MNQKIPDFSENNLEVLSEKTKKSIEELQRLQNEKMEMQRNIDELTTQQVIVLNKLGSINRLESLIKRNQSIITVNEDRKKRLSLFKIKERSQLTKDIKESKHEITACLNQLKNKWGASLHTIDQMRNALNKVVITAEAIMSNLIDEHKKVNKKISETEQEILHYTRRIKQHRAEYLGISEICNIDNIILDEDLLTSPNIDVATRNIYPKNPAQDDLIDDEEFEL